VRVAGPIVLLSAPAFPFTALGLADLFVVRSRSRIGLAEGDGGDTATV